MTYQHTKSRYNFSIKRVHMYNHLLRYEDAQGVIEVIVEDSPDASLGLLVWERDFSDDPERRRIVLEHFVDWANKRDLKYTVVYNKKRC